MVCDTRPAGPISVVAGTTMLLEPVTVAAWMAEVDTLEVADVEGVDGVPDALGARDVSEVARTSKLEVLEVSTRRFFVAVVVLVDLLDEEALVDVSFDVGEPGTEGVSVDEAMNVVERVVDVEGIVEELTAG